MDQSAQDNQTTTTNAETNKENVSTLSTSNTECDVLSLEVLAIIKESQSLHGLKHSDYQRYRQYCTKRIRRIRRTLAFVQSAGSKNFRGTFQLKPVTSVVVFESKKCSKDALRLLYIPLISAERCWAYAMQLKQEAAESPRKKFHMIRRFRKAVHWSAVLRDLCCSDEHQSKCDARTKLETTAYADYLNGLYYFEIDEWQKASDLLKNAQTIYEKLTQVINDEDMLGVYRARVDEIKPTLRYCAFNIGESKGIEKQKEFIDQIKTEVDAIEVSSVSSKIEQLINQTREKQAESLSEIEWLGKTLFIKHEKIRSFLLQLSDPANDWNELPFYEQLIFECRDCLQLLRDSNSDKSSLYQYLSYIRLDLIIKRNLQLVTTLQNVADLLRQYEIIIGCYNEIKQLNLGPFDEFLVEKFSADIDGQIVMYRAFRCYYIGQIGGQNWKESIALLDRSGQYAKQALENPYVNNRKETREELQKLLSKADADKFSIYAENICHDDDGGALGGDSNSSTMAGDKSKEPLIDRLNSFVLDDQEILTGNTPLTSLTPQYRAIPCKPLFFDLALNHIKFPNLDEEIKTNKPDAAGLTGMVKGWLGGWRK